MRSFATAGRAANQTRRQLSPRVVVIEADAMPSHPDSTGMLYLTQRSNTDRAFIFGDGSHPTTRLCAGAVDLLCRQRPGLAVLDVGCGTGVLARIARARGARFVAGTDIDPAAIERARLDAALDETTAPIQFDAVPPDHWGARFDLVVANILAEPLLELAPRLVGALANGGRLLISGFTRSQTPGLRHAFEALGVPFDRQAQLDEWVLLAS